MFVFDIFYNIKDLIEQCRPISRWSPFTVTLHVTILKHVFSHENFQVRPYQACYKGLTYYSPESGIQVYGNQMVTVFT